METVIFSSNIELLCESPSWSGNLDMSESGSSLVHLDDSDTGDDISFLEIASVDAKKHGYHNWKDNRLKKVKGWAYKEVKRTWLKSCQVSNAEKEAVDKSYKKQNSAVSIFSRISAIGEVVILVWGAGAIVTAGASFFLVIAGLITAVIGAVYGFSCN